MKMLLCNYLFYKGYELGIKTKSYKDIPVFGGVLIVGIWIILNLESILLLLYHFFHISLPPINRFFSAFVTVNALLIYYSYKGRGRKIVERFDQMNHPIYRLNPFMAVFGSLILASITLAFVGSYVNDFKMLKSILSF
ncbi:MAG: hypothetical protein IKH63_01245 [Prevotella sp.]|nr:hypothetical protein [Prevotella sp.]